MEAWTLDHYQRPRLASDVVLLAHDTSLEIERNGHRRVITVDDADAVREIGGMLDGLRDPDSDHWLSLRRQQDRGSWQILLQRLDEWSLIEDDETCDRAITATREMDEARKRCVAETLAYIEARAAAGARPALRAEAGRWLDMLAEDPAAERAWTDPNFYRGVAHISLARLRRANPPAFLAAVDILTTLAGRAAAPASAIANSGAANCYAIDEMRAHLTAVGDLLVLGLGPQAGRLCQPALRRAVPVSGTTFQRDVEQAMRKHAEEVGESSFALALDRLSSATAPVSVGCHVEEYHVTRRFVEMITPLMQLDLSPPLRALVYRYFAEEVGHESFERDTCLASGVDAEALESSCPLPLHVAFVDIFTQLAVLDPVAFLVAVPITEGMLGETSPFNVRLEQLIPADAEAHSVYRRHEQLNLDLHHASIARLALELVPAIPPQLQQRALNGLALVFELNFRAWEALAEFYGAQQTLRLHRPFDLGWESMQGTIGTR